MKGLKVLCALFFFGIFSCQASQEPFPFEELEEALNLDLSKASYENPCNAKKVEQFLKQYNDGKPLGAKFLAPIIKHYEGNDKLLRRVLLKMYAGEMMDDFDFFKGKIERVNALEYALYRNEKLFYIIADYSSLFKNPQKGDSIDAMDLYISSLFNLQIKMLKEGDYDKCKIIRNLIYLEIGERSCKIDTRVRQEHHNGYFFYALRHSEWVHRLRLAIEEKGKGSDYEELFFKDGYCDPEVRCFLQRDIKKEIYQCIENKNIYRLKALIHFYGLEKLKDCLNLNFDSAEGEKVVERLKFFRKVIRYKRKFKTTLNGASKEKEGKAVGQPPRERASFYEKKDQVTQVKTPQAAFDFLKAIAEKNRFKPQKMPKVSDFEGFIACFMEEKAPYKCLEIYYKEHLQSPQKVANCFDKFAKEVNFSIHSSLWASPFLYLLKELIEKEELFSLNEKITYRDKEVTFFTFLVKNLFYWLATAREPIPSLPFFFGLLAKNNLRTKKKKFLLWLFEKRAGNLDDVFFLWGYEERKIIATSEEEIAQQIRSDKKQIKVWQARATKAQYDLETIWGWELPTENRKDIVDPSQNEEVRLMKKIAQIKKKYKALRALVPLSMLAETNEKGQNMLALKGARAGETCYYNFEEILAIYEKYAPQLWQDYIESALDDPQLDKYAKRAIKEALESMPLKKKIIYRVRRLISQIKGIKKKCQIKKKKKIDLDRADCATFVM